MVDHYQSSYEHEFKPFNEMISMERVGGWKGNWELFNAYTNVMYSFFIRLREFQYIIALVKVILPTPKLIKVSSTILGGRYYTITYAQMSNSNSELEVLKESNISVGIYEQFYKLL